MYFDVVFVVRLSVLFLYEYECEEGEAKGGGQGEGGEGEGSTNDYLHSNLDMQKKEKTK
jgi:hypothetical protein